MRRSPLSSHPQLMKLNEAHGCSLPSGAVTSRCPLSPVCRRGGAAVPPSPPGATAGIE